MTILFLLIAASALAVVAYTLPDAIRRHKAHHRAVRVTLLIKAFAEAERGISREMEELGQIAEVTGSVFQDLYSAMIASENVPG